MICVGLDKRPEARVNHRSCESQWDEEDRKLLKCRLKWLKWLKWLK